MLADLRFSARSLTRAPGLAAALVFTIALGIGGNAMVYGFIRGSIHRNAELPDPSRVISVLLHDRSAGFTLLSPNDLTAVATSTTTLQSIGGLRETQAQATFGVRTTTLTVGAMAGAFIETLGIAKAAQPNEVLVSRKSWVSVFGGAAKFVGQSITVDNKVYRIAGLMPEQFEGLYAGRPIDVWMPIDVAALTARERAGHTLWVIARMRSGVAIDAATDEITSLLTASGSASVQMYSGVEPQEQSGVARIGALLPVAALFVFLVACANVASFLLARATGRAHETSVRVAIGATRRRIAQQLLSDAALIAIAGAAAGATAALWASRLVPAFLFSQDAEELTFAPGAAALWIATGVCIVITVLCGLAPLFELDDDTAAVLRREAAGLSPTSKRVRSSLVVGQIAVSCLLLICAGLVIASFRMALKTTLGNRLGEPVVATVTWSRGFGQEQAGMDFYEVVRERTLGVAGVKSAAWVSALPGNQPAWQPLRIEPSPTSVRTVFWRADTFPFDPHARVDFSRKSGRMLGRRDSPHSCETVMLNEAAAATFDGDPVGRLIEDVAGVRRQIVGVVSVRSTVPNAAPLPTTVYYYWEQSRPPVPAGTVAPFRIPEWSDVTEPAALDANVISPDYFGTIKAATASGTADFSNAFGGGCRVAVVNREAEEQFFGGKAVGRAVLTPGGERIDVIGVVSAPPLRVSQSVVEPAIFYPIAQSFLPRMTMMIETVGAPDPIVNELTRILNRVPEMTVKPKVRTLEAHLSATALAAERISSTLVLVCAVLSIVLATIGVYGAMAESVRQQQRELSLRVALGAQGWRLVWQVLRSGATLSAMGAAIGFAGALATDRWILHTPRGASAWMIWLAVPAMLALVVLIAAVVPARRALRADPLTLLKGA